LQSLIQIKDAWYNLRYSYLNWRVELNPLSINAILVLLGASLTFAFAPFNHWYIVFAVLPFCFYLIAFKTDTIFKSAWWFGLGYFGAGVSWIHVSIAEFGGLPLLASLTLMLLLCAYLALFPALLFKILAHFFKPSLWPLALPAGWLIMEWLRAHFLTGFPWLSIGYTQTDSFLSNWYPIIGEIGLSTLIVLVSISLCIGIQQKKWVLAFIPIAVVAITSLTIGNVAWTTPTGVVKSVALVQGNIPQSMRFDPEKDQMAMDKYLTLTNPVWNKDIIIWPEAAVPKLESLVQSYLKNLDAQATQTNTGLITGVINYDINTNIAYNSLIALGIDDEVNNHSYQINHSKRFSKHHLLPIGEFVPFEDILRPLAPIFDLPMSSFSRGEYVQNNLVAGNTYFAPAICFEIAFPKQISANLTEKSQVIVTVSNDAWFGDSHGPHQHLQIAQVRAKEFGLPVLRATNNGVSAIVNHLGEIQSQLPQFKALVLEDEIALVEGKTPYRKYGDFPIWLLLMTSLLIATLVKFTFTKT
jgi:apolipoprotein N-acyltransferase